MKNVSYSTILFSALSQDVLLSPVRNKIRPITTSVKKIIKNKSENNKKLFMSLSSLNLCNNINKYNLFKKRFYNTYLIKKSNNNSQYELNSKLKILYSFYNSKPLVKKKRLKIGKKFTKDFIIIKKQRYNSANSPYKKINYKIQKYNIEPYKKYLIDKNKIEMNRRAKEREIKYIMESKKQQKIKIENKIRQKFQGLDFSKQKKREFFLEKYLKSKQYTKTKEKIKKNDEDNKYFYKQFDYKYLKERLNFEVNERKYMFLDNDEFVPRMRYSSFNQRLKSFLRNIRENPNLNLLINYISKK